MPPADASQVQVPFAARRARLAKELGDAVLVLFAAPEALRNNDVHYDYRQDSDFFYLTGLDEPAAALVLTGKDGGTLTMFVQPKDKAREIWDGPRLGVDAAQQRFGAVRALESSKLEEELPRLLLGHQRIYCRLGERTEDEQRILRALRQARRLARRTKLAPTEIVDASVLIHEMRRVKSETELEHMRKAAAITEEGHRLAMGFARPGVHEYEVEAVLGRVFRERGAERHAYRPIVGSGANATILHYIRNDRQIQPGDLLLIDAGCEYNYYAADVTRTFPVDGRFSPAQRRVYEIVLRAQEEAIAKVVPGSTFEDIHAVSLRVITEGLIELGLLAGPLEVALAEERHKAFFMHGTGHYLGMDVHDVGPYSQNGTSRVFEPGVVVTVEPGIYVAIDNMDVPEEYRGIGIRIEDDILVTPAGNENLTAGVPKSIADVEAAVMVNRV
jgi:Xaa-Pro aminopeptidase